MSFPDPQALQQAEALATMLREIVVVPPDEAAEELREEVRRRARSLDTFVAHAPDPAQLGEQLAEVDVERVLQLIGTTRPALHLIAAAIVELGATARTITDALHWMELRPVASDPAQQHLGIDIAYIIAYRALTREQRWLLHTLAVWAAPPATISREFALAVAQNSGALLDLLVTAEDLDHLVALALVDRADLPAEAGEVTRSVSTTARVRLDPYVRYIATSGLASWTAPATLPDEIAHLGPVDLAVGTFTNWAVRFAEIVAGPTMPPVPELAPDDDDALETEVRLTPDPALEALTDAEAWAALEPEAPHLLAAAAYAREMDAAEQIYRLCQLLVPLLRRIGTPPARAVLRPLVELGLIAARAAHSASETLLLATQLADVALDDRDFPRAAAFADEALAAAIARKDLRAIGFATRRVAALAIRQGDAEKALSTARQAVILARANGTQAELNESITLLAAATKMGEAT